MYKLITIDLDGTLLNRYGEVTEYTKNINKTSNAKRNFGCFSIWKDFGVSSYNSKSNS